MAFLHHWRLEARLDEPWAIGADAFTTKTPREAGAAIRQRFNAVELDDPCAALHHAVNMMNGDVAVSWDGNELRLFGR